MDAPSLELLGNVSARYLTGHCLDSLGNARLRAPVLKAPQREFPCLQCAWLGLPCQPISLKEFNGRLGALSDPHKGLGGGLAVQALYLASRVPHKAVDNIPRGLKFACLLINFGPGLRQLLPPRQGASDHAVAALRIALRLLNLFPHS